jgi:desulfoferrodoxin (superoxide reductase-like protein)
MTNEDAYFEVWWALHRQKQWERNNLDRGQKPTAAFMEGLKATAKLEWIARANFHVSRGFQSREKADP